HQEINLEISSLNEIYKDKHKTFLEIETILQSKQGDVTLKDLIENEGKKELHNVLLSDIHNLDSNIGDLNRKIKSLEEDMRKAIDTKKASKIKQYYLSVMRKHLLSLGVFNLPESQYK